MTPQLIKEKIRQAEESVSDMKDEMLKKAAFETILAQLLGGSTSPVHVSTPQKKKPVKKTTSNRVGKSKSQVDQQSMLQLTLDQLQKLKEFYDSHAPDGTEAVVFTLAYFIHESLKQKHFHATDIQVVYQNLLSIKPVSRPPAMSLDEIKRAIRWLVAPSRKKQWLKDVGDGLCEISPQGVLRMTYKDIKK